MYLYTTRIILGAVLYFAFGPKKKYVGQPHTAGIILFGQENNEYFIYENTHIVATSIANTTRIIFNLIKYS